MTQSGTIIVQNLTNANNVAYRVGGWVPGSGIFGLASGNLGNPSSGTYQVDVNVSGYELYGVQFLPVGASEDRISVNEVVVEGPEATVVALRLSVE